MAEEPGKGYATPQDALNDLRPGWKVTGPGRAYFQTVPNEGAAANEPQTISKQIGVTYPVQGPDGQPDEITLGTSDTKVIWNTTPGAPLPAALVVIKGPAQTPTATATPAQDLVRLDANYQPLPAGSTQRPSYVRDPKSGTTMAVSADIQSDPSTWTPIYDPNDTSQVNRRVIALFDPTNNKVAASVPAPSGGKPSGEMQNVYVTNADGSKRLVALIDTGDKSFHPVAADPSTQKRTVQTSTAVYSVDDNDNVKKLIDIDKSQPYQAVIIDGVSYRFDPNEKDPTKALVQIGPGQSMPKQVSMNGVTYTLDPDTNKYTLPPGVPRPTTMTGAGTSSRWLIKYDAVTGEEISRSENPNYEKSKNLPQPNAVVPYIQVEDNSAQGWHWEENKGQVVASDALKNLAGILSGQVVDGKITVDEAKAIIEQSNQTMQNAASAAKTQLDFVSQGAQTGGQLLQKRADTAQGIMGQILGLAGQGQHYGGGGGTAGLSGGMMAAPAGIGSLITEGSKNYSAELLGGQPVMDAAARMVQAADPNSNLFSPESQAAVGVLGQMLNKYQQLNGSPHPAVQAASAANASVQNGGMAAPGTVPMTTQPNPVATGFKYDPRFTPEQPQQPPGTVLPPGVAGTVAPTDPRFLGTFAAPAMTRDVMGIQVPVQSGFIAPSMYVSGGGYVGS